MGKKEKEYDKLTKSLVEATVQDLVSTFLYYGRKEDEELPVARLEDAIARDVITQEMVVKVFSETLAKQWKEIA